MDTATQQETGQTNNLYDVFISYRRKGGSTVASLIYDKLKSSGINAFFDSEELDAGDFGHAIKTHRDSAPNFILVVSEGLFDRCESKEDWVRQEIAGALEQEEQNKKVIIPIFVNGVDGFPNTLPKDIERIGKFDALNLNHKDFNENFRKLLSRIKIERKERLVNAFIAAHDHDDDDDLQNIVETFRNCCEPKKAIEISAQAIKRHWQNDTDELLNSYQREFLVEICNKLELDNRGLKQHLLHRLKKWTKDKAFNAPPVEDDELVYQLAAESLECRDREQLSALLDNLNEDDFDDDIDRRKKDEMIEFILENLQPEFEDLFNNLSEANVKGIAAEVLGLESGRKNELLEKFKEHFNKLEMT